MVPIFITSAIYFSLALVIITLGLKVIGLKLNEVIDSYSVLFIYTTIVTALSFLMPYLLGHPLDSELRAQCFAFVLAFFIRALWDLNSLDKNK